MRTTTRRLGRLAALATILGLVGCSSSDPVAAVTGRVHKNGEPLPVKELPSGAGGRVMVRFHSMDASAKSPAPYAAMVKSDGTFSVPGDAGKGIPHGKYRVEVTWQDSFPMGKDKLDGKFGKANSPIIVDIPSAEDIDINVASAKGK